MSAPEPYWADPDVTLYLGKCETVLPGLPANSIDAIVTDPPGAISFMGREWDSDRGGRDRWVEWLTGCMTEAVRVLKPGGHALVWALPRTSGWTQWALEDAGFEIRDCIVHMFGSGMPKGLNVSKAIDKAAGARREVIGERRGGAAMKIGGSNPRPWHERQAERGGVYDITAPATEDAARWEGWNVALKPGQEMWWLVRKPFRGTVVANVLEHGTGALNIASCRVGSPEDKRAAGTKAYAPGRLAGATDGTGTLQSAPPDGLGRWPTNILLTHSAACEVIGTRHLPGDSRSGQESGDRPGGFGDVGADSGSERPNGRLYGAQVVEVFRCAGDCPVGELDRQSGVSTSSGGYGPATARSRGRNVYAGRLDQDVPTAHEGGLGDTGGASRFYPTFRYQAKAPAHERPRLADGTAHSTVKPQGLMRWLARLITPPGGTVLDMFAGTGSTAEACLVEGFQCVLIEQDPQSAELIRTRLRKDIQPDMFGGVAS